MTEHMSELVSIMIKGAAHVHQNACYLLHLEHISAAEFHTAMKGEEGKDVALVTEGLLNVDTDS